MEDQNMESLKKMFEHMKDTPELTTLYVKPEILEATRERLSIENITDGYLRYQRIIDHYGVKNQLLKLAEESTELADAAFKLWKELRENEVGGNQHDIAHLFEEMADVSVMITQIRFAFNWFMDSSAFNTIIDRKLDRTIRRIENEDNT